MQALVERIRAEGRDLGGGILKVDSFINHQFDPALTMEMGKAFAQGFAQESLRGVSKVVTAEVSGIAPAFATGYALGVPVVYARKKRPVTMSGNVYEAEAPSHTKGGVTKLTVSSDYLGAKDRVLLIDDFLASGRTIAALAKVIKESGATLCGIGCVIEKAFEGGRRALSRLGVPIVTLAVIERMDESGIVVRSGD
ncbi:MAG: xanthine phosphoribosyltransferase [Deinococcota bacterium]|jgi:xanthine phosphoribosyltransferase|nr:xanthine phosphoribosyltransferase [Deinococcota bacterium]